ncbi:MAG: hypothetical protein LIO93_06460 [Bacteroidales bacterium]|nr:hypothetical protein [Bacteroidales bacterium]
MNQDTIKYSSYIELLEKGLFEIAPEEFEKKLLQGIPSGKYIPGYEFGIARYLIYFFYKNMKDEGKDVSRFNRLFL